MKTKTAVYRGTNYPRYKVTETGQVFGPSGKALRPSVHGSGYRRVIFWVDGSGKLIQLGRLVCETFHGPPPGPEYDAGHLDDDPSNNRLGNLAWQTRSENMRQCTDRGRRGKRPPQGKLSASEKDRIIELHEAGIAGMEIIRRLNLSIRRSRLYQVLAAYRESKNRRQ